ncbi:MAG: hypothetical protein HY052_02710 [Proteobacteria bacterium]|nr:hypothetical protein [Pseudomonadota bacterium]
MASPIWTRLDREQTYRVLDQLSAQRDAVVFSRDVTEVTWRQLPFYINYRLYRVTNYATMPTFSMMYLSNEEEYIALDSTPDPIYSVNEKDPIRLNEVNIIPYLEFFFNNVHGSDGDVHLIKDPHKMPFMSSLNPAQRQSIINRFKPLTVSADSLHNLDVSGTFHYGGGLIMATLVITPQGKMSFQDQNLLLSGIRFPASPYSQAWLEG